MKARLQPRINLARRTALETVIPLATRFMVFTGGDVRQQSMKEIWNSERMNALRLQQFIGRRRQDGVCGNCGQLSHYLPDNIEAHRVTPTDKFKKLVSVNPNVDAPGGTREFTTVAAA